MSEDLLQFRVSPAWREVEIISEPYVILNSFGYIPAVMVKVENKNIEQFMYINPKTLAEPLDKLKIQNNNIFTGIKLKIRKASEERTAKYETEEL